MGSFLGELAPQDQALVEAAALARDNAYAPYSGFKVGAAIRARDGLVYAGCNVENVSFGGTICAERSALACAVSRGARDFETIAIVTDAERPAAPCGICRQVLAEFSPDLHVILANTDGVCEEHELGDLLPQAFLPEMLTNTPDGNP